MVFFVAVAEGWLSELGGACSACTEVESQARSRCPDVVISSWKLLVPEAGGRQSRAPGLTLLNAFPWGISLPSANQVCRFQQARLSCPNSTFFFFFFFFCLSLFVYVGGARPTQNRN